MRISDWSSDVCSSDLVRLAVALPQAREDADDAQVALGTEDGIGAAEAGLVEATAGDVALQHRFGEIGRYVTPRIFQQRDEVIGAMAGHGILEVEQAETGRAFATGQPAQVQIGRASWRERVC